MPVDSFTSKAKNFACCLKVLFIKNSAHIILNSAISVFRKQLYKVSIISSSIVEMTNQREIAALKWDVVSTQN